MIEFGGRGILLDIEGTTSSVRFVYDVLFPYARQQVAGFLATNWDAPDVREACEQIARDAGGNSLSAWTATDDPDAALQIVVTEVYRLMDRDAKVTGLKALQGLIWKEGYRTGQLSSHVYDDVPPALAAWREAGLDIRIYSSGSIMAQKEFFAHTRHGDLTRFFRGHYDTTTGPKKEASSYTTIARDMQMAADMILFCSDAVAELDAAGAAGMQTALVVRPENPPVSEGLGHSVIPSFDHLLLRN